MYADYDYYQTEYGGKMSADDYRRFGRRAERRIDGITGNKLQFAFPTNERDVEAVRDCACELADFLYQIDSYNQSAMKSMGTVAQADGTVKGKVIMSISSGSESIGYSAASSSSTATMEAAKDKKVADTMIYGMVRDGLGGVPDANGVNLLYAGEYPRRNAPISRPPEDKPVEKPEEPSEPQENVNTASETHSETQISGSFGAGYDDSVVIYNYYYNATLDSWQYYGTRIDGVKLEFTQEKNENQSGSQDVSVCLLSIKNDSALPKPYLECKQWAKLTGVEMTDYFTLNTEGDFFVLVKRADLNLDIEAPVGLVDDRTSPYMEEGGVLDYMKKNYDHVYNVSSFASFKGLPHFEVGGK